ncbi:MAG TPA: MlaD family protein [Nitrospira sp.]|nr:MlaD family protein [Nitrospira sp.]
MGQNRRYFKIGLFVITAVVLTVAGLVAFGGAKWFEKLTLVETYFTESVQGLEVGAPVRIHGVAVGRVESISLAREEYGIIVNPDAGVFPFKGVVVVRMSVRPSVALQFPAEDMNKRMKMAADAGFRFRLASQGITGVLYVESEFLDPERYPPMEIAWTPKTPYVPSAPSTITELGADLRSITRRLEQVEIDKITRDLDAMLTSVTQVVQEVRDQHLAAEAKQAMSELRGTIQEARRVIDSSHVSNALKDSAAAMADIRHTAADLRHTAKDAREAMAQFPDAMSRLNKSLRRIDSLLADKGETVDDLLENLRSVSEELRYLTKTAETYPSQVLFGEAPPRTQAVKR